MATILQLHDRCMIPSIMYNSETWVMTAKERQKLEQMQINALRRYLKAPKSVPKMAFYLELGIYPLEAVVDIRQFKYLWRMLNSTTRVKHVVQTQILLNSKGSWTHQVQQRLAEYNLPQDPNIIRRIKKGRWSRIVNSAVTREHNQRIYDAASKSAKLTRITMMKCTPILEDYMHQLNR